MARLGRSAISETSSSSAKPSSSPAKRTAAGWGSRLLPGPLLLAVATFLSPSLGQAEVGVEAASVTAKGTVGGALLGAEAVVLAEAAFGVKPRWAYLVGAGVGAAGGGVGGYFLERSMSPQVGMFMLAGGMVLAIPATVAALSASAYSPEDYVEINDRAAVESSQTARASAPSLQMRPPGLLGLDEGTWSLGVPAVSVLDVYPLEMRHAFQLNRETELRVSVLAMRF